MSTKILVHIHSRKQVSIKRIIFQEVVVYSYNNTLVDNKKKSTTVTRNHGDKSQRSQTQNNICVLY